MSSAADSESEAHAIRDTLKDHSDASMSFAGSTSGATDLMVFINNEDEAEEWIDTHLDAVNDELFHDTHIADLGSKAGAHI